MNSVVSATSVVTWISSAASVSVIAGEDVGTAAVVSDAVDPTSAPDVLVVTGSGLSTNGGGGEGSSVEPERGRIS